MSDHLKSKHPKTLMTAILLLVCAAAENAHAQNIYTVAGNGGWEISGDGGAAENADLGVVRAVAVGPDGVLYIADNDGVRTVDARGVITRFLLTSEFGWPQDMDIDSAGNLFIVSDTTVFKVTPSKVVTKLAGSGIGFSGDGGPAIDATFAGLRGIAVHASGDIFVADSRNNRIRKIAPDGIISTVAGNGAQGNYGDGGPAVDANLYLPEDVDVDDSGRIFIADTMNWQIRVVSTEGIIETQGGQAVPAGFVTVGKTGEFYHGWWKVSHDVFLTDAQGTTTVVAGSGASGYWGDDGPAVDAWLNGPFGAVLDSAGNLYVADALNHVVRKIVFNDIGTWTSDYDGDGWADILWRNIVTGANAIWLTASHAAQKSVASVTSPGWHIATRGDFNGDGVSDLWWRNSNTGANIIWHSAEQARAVTATRVSDLSWKIVGAGDFNGDGASDLLWRNISTGAGSVWYSGRSSTRFTFGSISHAWEIVGVGDFNADGRSDILWRNRNSGANVIWRSGLRSSQQPVAGVTNLDWKIVGVGDFDGEGHSDILWRNMRRGANVIWKAADSKRTSAVTGVANQSWQIRDIADYDGDRKSDVLWHNNAYGRSVIWRSGLSSSQLAVRGVSDRNWLIVP